MTDSQQARPATETSDRDIQQLAVAILRIQQLIDDHPLVIPTNLLQAALDQGQEQP
jgi:hypothetical protein